MLWIDSSVSKHPHPLNLFLNFQLDDRDGEFFVLRPVVSLPETNLKLTADNGKVPNSVNYIINFNHVMFKVSIFP